MVVWQGVSVHINFCTATLRGGAASRTNPTFIDVILTQVHILTRGCGKERCGNDGGEEGGPRYGTFLL